MKRKHYVLPLAALIIAAVWLTYLRGSNSALEQDNLSLEKKIEKYRSTTVLQNERNRTEAMRSGAMRSKMKREMRSAEAESKPSGDWVGTSRDWNAIVLFNNNEGVRFNLTPACRRLEALASEMSGDELIRAYTQMATLPVDAPFRNYLESSMLNELKKKNPEFAFTQLLAKCQNEDTGPIKMGDFDEWLAKDPAAAASWYEKQIAANVFDKTLDGKTPNMVPFEAAFMMSLLASDPAAAEERMNNISPELRASLGDYVWSVPKENSKDFIDLLRKSMPVEDYVAILKNNSLTEDHFRFDSETDPKDVQKNLDSLALSPEERAILLTQHFEELAKDSSTRERYSMPSREKFDKNRARIQAIDPSSADRATGFALKSYLEESNTISAQEFVEKVAMDYHSSGSGDEIMVPLIEGSANGSIPFPKERARVMAGKITDSKLREEMLEKLK